jgi:hypothetical protein
VAGSDELGQKVKNPFTALLGLYVSDFQVIRTTISGKLLKPPPKPVSYKSAHRICFVVKPPFAGEQRVTNPIDLELIYKATGAAMVGVSDTEVDIPKVEISQLLMVKAKFVDVLLYISQSAGGFTESFKTTVKPVLEILKNDESSRRQRNESKANASALPAAISRRSLMHLLKSAPTVATIQLEGLQITCVPSGATRLNESPIIKIELKHFRSGVAAVPLTLEGRRPPANSSNLLSGVDLMHTTVAGWVACEITGHYHNRRLVAWEPFVEPWTAEVRFGIDASEIFGLTPVATSGHGEIKSSPTMGNALDNITGNSSSLTISDGTGDRLRDFGRLFRAPFQSSLSTKQRTNDQSAISHADFCFLMLASTSRTTILSIMYPSTESNQEKETKLFSRLPKREKVEWLRGFGFPGRENNELYSATCVLSDSKPLNINITGALLENVLGYLHSLKSDELRQVAPHWIRNDTGMVSNLDGIESY